MIKCKNVKSLLTVDLRSHKSGPKRLKRLRIKGSRVCFDHLTVSLSKIQRSKSGGRLLLDTVLNWYLVLLDSRQPSLHTSTVSSPFLLQLVCAENWKKTRSLLGPRCMITNQKYLGVTALLAILILAAEKDFSVFCLNPWHYSPQSTVHSPHLTAPNSCTSSIFILGLCR